MRRGLLGVAVVLALAAVACSNAKDTGSSTTTEKSNGGSGQTNGKFPAVNQPGVTADAINVGGVASVTNPLGGNYGYSFLGTQAYFDMINVEGGIYGRKLILAEQRDDKLANNKAEVDALISDQNIFAVLPVAVLLFTRRRRAGAGEHPDLRLEHQPRVVRHGRGPEGQHVRPGRLLPRLHRPDLLARVAGPAAARQEASACSPTPCRSRPTAPTGVKNSFEKYGKSAGAKIVFTDKSLSFGATDLCVQVSKMKEAGVDLVTTCMDTQRRRHAGQGDEEAGARRHAVPARTATTTSSSKQFGDLFEGSVVRTDFTQWQLPEDQQPQGLKDFLKWMDKSGKDSSTRTRWRAGSTPTSSSQGLKAAGPDFNRQKVIDAINKMTDYTPTACCNGVDWTKQHTAEQGPERGLRVRSTIKDGKFDPNFSKPGKPFHCVTADRPRRP